MEDPRKNPPDKGGGELGGARVEGRHKPSNRVTPRTLAGRSPTRRGSRRSDRACPGLAAGDAQGRAWGGTAFPSRPGRRRPGATSTGRGGRRASPRPPGATGAHRTPAAETPAQALTPTGGPGTTPSPSPAGPLSPRRPPHRNPGPEPAKKASEPRTRGARTHVTAPPPAFARPGRTRGISTARSLAGEPRARTSTRTRAHWPLAWRRRTKRTAKPAACAARARRGGAAELHFPGGSAARGVRRRRSAGRLETRAAAARASCGNARSGET